MTLRRRCHRFVEKHLRAWELLLALFAAAGIELPRARGFGGDEDLIMVPDAPPQCSVCLAADVGAALQRLDQARACAEYPRPR